MLLGDVFGPLVMCHLGKCIDSLCMERKETDEKLVEKGEGLNKRELGRGNIRPPGTHNGLAVVGKSPTSHYPHCNILSVAGSPEQVLETRKRLELKPAVLSQRG